MLEEIVLLYGENASSALISDSIGMLINNTKYNYMGSDAENGCSGRCIRCNGDRGNNASYHITFECPRVPRPADMTWKWKEGKDFKENLKFLRGLASGRELLGSQD